MFYRMLASMTYFCYSRGIYSSRPTLLSLNRFEGKKNAMLALQAFLVLLDRKKDLKGLRLVLAG